MASTSYYGGGRLNFTGGGDSANSTGGSTSYYGGGRLNFTGGGDSANITGGMRGGMRGGNTSGTGNSAFMEWVNWKKAKYPNGGYTKAEVSKAWAAHKKKMGIKTKK